MKFSQGALLAGIILIVLGFFNTLIGLYEWHCDEELLKTGSKAVGTITDAVTYPQDDSVNTGQYRFVAEFKSEDNKTCYAKSRFASRAKDKYLNTKVTVIYDPGNPERSRFEHDISIMRDVYEYIFMFVPGIGLLLFGIYRNR